MNDFDENALNEALGNPANGEKETEAAEPSKAGKQSREENSRYAAARRKAESEKDKAIEEMKHNFEEEKKRDVAAAVDAVYAEMGLSNPYRPGKKILSKADYEQYQQDHREKIRSKAASGTGLSKEEFDAVFPDTAKKAEESPAPAAEDSKKGEADKKIEAELQRISAISPNYKSLDDIVKGPHGAEFSAYVEKNGLSFIDAFKLAYGDEIRKTPAKGKDHLQSTQAVGAATFDEPDEKTIALYHDMMPDLTDEEIMQKFRDARKYIKR